VSCGTLGIVIGFKVSFNGVEITESGAYMLNKPGFLAMIILCELDKYQPNGAPHPNLWKCCKKTERVKEVSLDSIEGLCFSFQRDHFLMVCSENLSHVFVRHGKCLIKTPDSRFPN
jgi:hypothetical protein